MRLLFKIIAVLALTSSPTFAATVYKTGKVTSVKMFSSVVVIYVDSLSNSCTGGIPRVAIKNDDPVFSSVVAAALAAKTTGATVEIGYHQECTHQSKSWDFESFWIK